MKTDMTTHEQILYDIACQLLGTNDFTVEDDLFDVGLDSISALDLIDAAEEKHLKIKMTDVMKTRNIRGILKANSQLCGWHNPYDDKKPIVVVPQGIMLFNDMVSKLDMLSQQFSVFIIENVEEHYHTHLEGKTYQEIVDFYLDLLHTHLPENAAIFAMAGASWGGLLAFSLTERWSRQTGQKPTVLMMDTHLSYTDFYPCLLNGTLDDFCREYSVPKERLNPSFIRRGTILARIEEKGREMPTYDGRVILMNALQVPPKFRWQPADNVNAWKQLAPNLKVDDYDYPHDTLCESDDVAAAFCQYLFDLI